jgi:nucleotide-binding universal stress UspA family protein
MPRNLRRSSAPRSRSCTSSSPRRSTKRFSASIEYLARAADEAERRPGGAFDRLRDAAREKLSQAVAVLPEPRPDMATVIAEGRPSVEIVDYANQNNVDLIVVGTQGRSRLGKAFLGSVADNLVRQSDVPVMVVRK